MFSRMRLGPAYLLYVASYTILALYTLLAVVVWLVAFIIAAIIDPFLRYRAVTPGAVRGPLASHQLPQEPAARREGVAG